MASAAHLALTWSCHLTALTNCISAEKLCASPCPASPHLPVLKSWHAGLLVGKGLCWPLAVVRQKRRKKRSSLPHSQHWHRGPVSSSALLTAAPISGKAQDHRCCQAEVP